MFTFECVVRYSLRWGDLWRCRTHRLQLRTICYLHTPWSCVGRQEWGETEGRGIWVHTTTEALFRQIIVDFFKGVHILANRTAHRMTSYWHDTVVCLSVCLSVMLCKLQQTDASFDWFKRLLKTHLFKSQCLVTFALFCTLQMPFMYVCIVAKCIPYILLPSNRRHLSCDDCLEDRSEDYQNCSVLYCVPQLYTVISTHTHMSSCYRCTSY